jgi:hypothetical protein
MAGAGAAVGSPDAAARRKTLQNKANCPPAARKGLAHDPGGAVGRRALGGAPVSVEREGAMKFLIAFGCAIAATLILLVDPRPERPVETVDTVASCVQKYWHGKPIEKWNTVEGMDSTCRAIMARALREENW